MLRKEPGIGPSYRGKEEERRRRRMLYPFIEEKKVFLANGGGVFSCSGEEGIVFISHLWMEINDQSERAMGS